ncbi:hypothetical protein Tco_1195700, partial [Tanacetum coccineum]
KRPYEVGRLRLMMEIFFPLVPQSSLTDGTIILEGAIEGYYIRMIYVDGGSSSKIMYEHGNYKRAIEKQNCAAGVCNSKVSLTLQRDNRMNGHEKLQGHRFHHSFNDQVSNAKRE